ncbi:hypothetical protein PC9H_010528 [Pleurotus ostreatus]|uniref:Uncharacterized protein n=2 Tax=Pleurotus TaxID=5320 RepID=A0A8H6ZJW9_PLEOS|nr:uncharacterized protein PC9H_010528 [Pleurotus ostreatus]KAF7422372.1 hypothetical protein PC9H_010528 [Pleurotus ostreatus]KAG9227737.1 hypothetical protein CCMSSC00406_0000617 [Pleurotus cornucopiae]KAJ8691797.1 hypothetical protein PTI98_011331 [Pleurotus ostreatus]
MHYQQPRLSKCNEARQIAAVSQLIPEVDDHPWEDLTQRYAAHCAQFTWRCLRASPNYRKKPAFAAPEVDLEAFIDDLLYESGAPLSAAVTALMIISWITDTGACRLASSSPHHLFLAVYEVLLRTIYAPNEPHDDGGQAAAVLMRWEVEAALETLSERQVQFVLALIDEDTVIEEEMRTLVTEPYTYECIHCQEKARAESIGRIKTAYFISQNVLYCDF